MDITRWSTPKSDWLYFLQLKMEKLYSQQKQDQERTVAQIMNSLLPNSDLNWSRENHSPFRYDLNQIPYDYTLEVRNRFKGLDLIDMSAWRTMDGGSWHCTGARDQDHPQDKEMQKSKMVLWGGLTNSCEKKRTKKQKRKGKIYPLMISAKK